MVRTELTRSVWLPSNQVPQLLAGRGADTDRSRHRPRYPVSKSLPSVPADDLELGLRDLIRDWRSTEVGGEEPQTLQGVSLPSSNRQSYRDVFTIAIEGERTTLRD